MSGLMINSNDENTVSDSWIEGGYATVNGLDPANAGKDLGTWQRNQFDRMRYDNPGIFYGMSPLGSYNASPRLTLNFTNGAIVNSGAGTANEVCSTPQA